MVAPREVALLLLKVDLVCDEFCIVIFTLVMTSNKNILVLGCRNRRRASTIPVCLERLLESSNGIEQHEPVG